MLISNVPAKTDLESGEPFSGMMGELVDYMLDEAGVTRESVYITHALKCKPPGNRKVHTDEYHACFEQWLRGEINLVDPAIVVLLGRDTWRAVTGGDRFEFEHKGMFESKRRKFIMSYHPGYFLRTGDIENFVSVGTLIRDAHTPKTA